MVLADNQCASAGFYHLQVSLVDLGVLMSSLYLSHSCLFPFQRLYVAVPYGCIGFYDPAEMHHQGTLRKHTRLASFRVGFYLVHFFIYLYLFIISFLTGT